MFGSLLLMGSMMLGQVEAPVDAESVGQDPVGQDPVERDLSLEVRRLLRRLDAAQLSQREAAEQALIELGVDVLDFLPDEAASAEVRQRVTRIRLTLQRALAESAMAPSTVTLDAQSMPLSEILTAIEEQTGNKLIDRREGFGQPAEDPQLSITLENTPFWQAIQQVFDQAALTVYPYGEEKAVYYVAQAQGGVVSQSGPTSTSGPFRFEAIRVESVRDLRDPNGQATSVWLEVAWEPRLSPISLQLRLADLRAVDENGDPLAIASPAATLNVPLEAESYTTQLRIPLELPSRDVKRIAQLQGKLGTLVQGKTLTFRFDKLAKARNVEQRSAGVTVVLEKVRKNHDVWEVRIRVRFDKANDALASHRNWIFDNRAYLDVPGQDPIPFDFYEPTFQGENEVGVAYLFGLDELPPAGVFVYETPGTILKSELEFQLSDVPLP